jgi:nucleoid-associated protein YgaU
MFPTIAGGVVIVAIAGWVLFTQTGILGPDEPVPVVQAQSEPTAEPAEAPAAEEMAPVETSETPAQDQPAADGATEDMAETSEALPVEETPEDQPATPAPVPAPDFDVVRVESDGTTVIAGTGPAGWNIAILVDGEEMASTQIDSSGQFVAFLDLGTSDLARVMTLRATDGQTILLSDAQVIIAPVEVQVAEVDPTPEAEETPDTAAPEETVETVAADEAAEVTEATGTAETTAQNDAVEEETVETATTDLAEDLPTVTETILEDAGAEIAMAEAVESETSETSTEAKPTGSSTVTVIVETTTDTPAQAAEPAEMASTAGETSPSPAAETETPTAEPTPDAQTTEPAEPTEAAPAEPAAPAVLLVDDDGVNILQPAANAPEVLEDLSIAAITYADDGSVFLTGFSPAGFLRVYVNNQQVIILEVPEPGEWTAELVDVQPGVYTLRVDQVDENGDVMQRVETPFKREAPQKVVEAAQSRRPLVSQQVVQPGSTLWAISREAYGSGVLFVRIFEANKNQIRNPDLIYPGQIFALPAPPGAQKTKRASGQ